MFCFLLVMLFMRSLVVICCGKDRTGSFIVCGCWCSLIVPQGRKLRQNHWKSGSIYIYKYLSLFFICMYVYIYKNYINLMIEMDVHRMFESRRPCPLGQDGTGWHCIAAAIISNCAAVDLKSAAATSLLLEDHIPVLTLSSGWWEMKKHRRTKTTTSTLSCFRHT